MLYIKCINGKYYIMTAEGYILHSENTLDDLRAYCAEKLAAQVANGNIKEA